MSPAYDRASRANKLGVPALALLTGQERTVNVLAEYRLARLADDGCAVCNKFVGHANGDRRPPLVATSFSNRLFPADAATDSGVAELWRNRQPFGVLIWASAP